MAARRAHNPEVVGSSPTPAKDKRSPLGGLFVFNDGGTRRVSTADQVGGKGAMGTLTESHSDEGSPLDGTVRLKPRPGDPKQDVEG